MTETTHDKIIKQYNLTKNNTMALSCIASHAMILDDANTLKDDITHAINFAKQQDLAIFVLSGGSNVLLPSRLDCLVLLPRYQGIEVIAYDDDGVNIKVAGGENWHHFIQHCLHQGWYGLENLALIPGLVGACPVQNIGAYGVQVSDFIINVIAFDLTTGEQLEFDNTACQFEYRHSVFKDSPNRYLISHVVFKLHTSNDKVLTNYGDLAVISHKFAKAQYKDTPSPKNVFDAVVQIRSDKLPDPNILANCGSFFQNPIIAMSDFKTLQAQYPTLPSYPIDDGNIKIPAGWLIDQAGLKGKGIFPILTHEKQALVLTNHTPYTASQDDIKATQSLIIDTILQKFGIQLVREPVWITADGQSSP
ncbi:UDP-N-acetylmuramate dehydrogenase [Moraxella haemolytica]|uniref:UDP-N-acetylmuramate dehydrogenase n=1 Tax=Moraxella haemolytica TaxID=2904119 RepID=UPI002543FA39|nr:UDP-N-acetylmuramate dehydrogenase [Moraxella sp. ZY171148]WII95811.1 UDP-N-acetylmuramate dehydrogenase [Moraxella sp. ZY171148]